MTPVGLAFLIAKVRYPGWWFLTNGMTVRLQVANPPPDARKPGYFPGLADEFVVAPDWDEDKIIDRLFCTLQYLCDHEMREHFTVAGRQPYDAHTPSVTGQQRDWFVEHQSALAGY